MSAPLAYIRSVSNLAPIDYYIMPVAGDDAAHLGLEEKEVAQIIALIIWDPGAGPPLPNGRFVLNWRNRVRAEYKLSLSNAGMMVFLMRLKPVRRASRISRFGAALKPLMPDLVRQLVNQIIAGGKPQ